MVNIYIVYKINLRDRGYDDQLTFENSLFFYLKNADIHEYKYSGYGVGFDRNETFSIGNGFGKNVIIFGVDMSLSAHSDNKKKIF